MTSMIEHMNDFRREHGFIPQRQVNMSDIFLPLCSYNGTNSSDVNTTNCSLDGHFLRSINNGRILHNPYGCPIFLHIFHYSIFGNLLCLRVFMSKNMRKLSASIYIAAHSTSDLMALFFYVLPQWLKYGLTSLPGHNTAIFLQQQGTCQIMLYLQYIARFLSSWLVVFFTIDRFIGVCFPLRRKDICDPKSASRVILVAIIVASTGCVFKPILSGGDPLCGSDPDHKYLSFILDSIFGVTITFISFVLITLLNLLIIRKLVLRNRRHWKIRMITEELIIRLEFTFILLAISICFVYLNLPYFAIWCQRYWTYRQMFVHSKPTPKDHDTYIGDLNEIFHVTSTIFYINYFSLYSITGAYFRKELKHLFLHKERGYKYNHHYSAYYSRSNSHSTPQSWV